MELPNELAGFPYKQVTFDNKLDFKKMYAKIDAMRKWYIFKCLRGRLLTFCT